MKGKGGGDSISGMEGDVTKPWRVEVAKEGAWADGK